MKRQRCQVKSKLLQFNIFAGIAGFAALFFLLLSLRQSHAPAKSVIDENTDFQDPKYQLLSTVSHDIRTPLSGILGMIHLLNDTKLSAEQRNYLSGIRQSSQALSQLVNDLLDFSSLEAGRFNVRPQDVEPRVLIEGIVEMLSPGAHDKGIEVASAVSSTVPATLSFDAARLRQVLYNVIGNAVKFTQTGGILVEAHLDGADFMITVTDTGPGMSAAEQSKVFAAFEQAGSNQQKSGGTGLGLTISARIMKEFNGTLTLTSQEGQGTIFTVRLPVELQNTRVATNPRGKVLHEKRVLLVAPKGPAAQALTKTITTLGGAADFAEDKQQARTVLRTMAQSGTPVTAMIVDHRLADLMGADDTLCPAEVQKILLVSPEARNRNVAGAGFDSWLIRPLRERSLVDVLCRRLSGVEIRDPVHDGQTFEKLPDEAAKRGESRDVLLAEDDAVCQMLARATLQKAGNRVRTVETFNDLLNSATESDQRPDIIITDLDLHGGCGLDAIDFIRAHEQQSNLPNLPIIVLTANAARDLAAKARAAGASGLLLKPADPVQLNALVAQLTAVA